MPENHLHFTTIGSYESPAILFLHGFLGSGRDWVSIGERFSSSHFIILPDLPGHGRSSTLHKSQYTFQSTVDNLNDLLLSLGARNTTVVGYSMGARIALNLALEYPQSLKSVVLEGCNPGVKTANERKMRAEWELGIIEGLKQSDIRNFVAEWYRMPIFRSLESNITLFESVISARIQNQNIDGLIASLKGLGLSRQPDFWPRLEEIKLPVLLLSGELDDKFRIIAEEMSGIISSSRLGVIKGGGHMAHYENEAGFVDVLLGFLNVSK